MIQNSLPLFFEKAPFLTICAIGFYIGLSLLLLYCLTPERRTSFKHFFLIADNSSRSYYPALDSFRGLAALWIAAYHTHQYLGPFSAQMNKQIPFGILGNGYEAVSLFVVLSGFLIYGIVKHKVKNLADIKQYLINRFLRIYPLYLFIALLLILMGATSSPRHIISEIFMLRVFQYPYYSHPIEWCLYVEVAFYLLIPIWVAICQKKIVPITLFAVFLLFIQTNLDRAEPPDFKIIKYFLIGILGFELHKYLLSIECERPKLKKIMVFSILLIGIYSLHARIIMGTDPFAEILNIFFKSWTIPIYIHNAPFYSLSIGLGFVCIMLASIHINFFEKCFSILPLRFLGTISYSLFLLHGLIIITDTTKSFHTVINLSGNEGYLYGDITTLFILYLPAYIFVSTITFAIVEKPFLTLKKKLKQRKLAAPERESNIPDAICQTNIN